MKYTLEQIIKCWREVYGEDMETEYSGFIKELQKEDKWNIAKDQSVILIKPRTAYAVRKERSIIKLVEHQALIIWAATAVHLDVRMIGSRSLVNKLSITSAEYMSQLN